MHSLFCIYQLQPKINKTHALFCINQLHEKIKKVENFLHFQRTSNLGFPLSFSYLQLFHLLLTLSFQLIAGDSLFSFPSEITRWLRQICRLTTSSMITFKRYNSLSSCTLLIHPHFQFCAIFRYDLRPYIWITLRLSSRSKWFILLLRHSMCGH